MSLDHQVVQLDLPLCQFARARLQRELEEAIRREQYKERQSSGCVAPVG